MASSEGRVWRRCPHAHHPTNNDHRFLHHHHYRRHHHLHHHYNHLHHHHHHWLLHPDHLLHHCHHFSSPCAHQYHRFHSQLQGYLNFDPSQLPQKQGPVVPISTGNSSSVGIIEHKVARSSSAQISQELEHLELEEEDDGDPVFVLTDEWREFFAKSEAKRQLEMKQRKKGKK